MTRVLLSVCLLSVAAACDAPTQAESCAAYTECIRALDEARGQETNLDRFDPGGACWNGGEGAKVCEKACTAGMALVAERWPDAPTECSP